LIAKDLSFLRMRKSAQELETMGFVFATKAGETQERRKVERSEMGAVIGKGQRVCNSAASDGT
jgi:hypothetical protein